MLLASIANTDAKKLELSKDISAFANSAGGTILYGVEEDGHCPTRIDLGLDRNEVTKEWIEQVVNPRSRATHSLSGDEGKADPLKYRALPIVQAA